MSLVATIFAFAALCLAVARWRSGGKPSPSSPDADSSGCYSCCCNPFTKAPLGLLVVAFVFNVAAVALFVAWPHEQFMLQTESTEDVSLGYSWALLIVAAVFDGAGAYLII